MDPTSVIALLEVAQFATNLVSNVIQGKELSPEDWEALDNRIDMAMMHLQQARKKPTP